MLSNVPVSHCSETKWSTNLLVQQQYSTVVQMGSRVPLRDSTYSNSQSTNHLLFSLPFALKLGQSICSSKYYPLSPVSWTVETQTLVRVMLMIQFFCYFLYCTERSSIREAMVESKLLRQGASVVWNMGW